MVDFNKSESAFLVVRSTRCVWFDSPQRFPRSFAKVPISFCFAPGEGAQVQTELGPTASVKAGITSLSPSLLGAEACGVKNNVVVKEEVATEVSAAESAAAEESATVEATTEEAVVAEESATKEATKSAAAEVSAAAEAVAEEESAAEESDTVEATTEGAVVAEESATVEATTKSAAAEVSAAAEAVAAEAPVAEEVVAEEAAKEVEKPAKTVCNTPDPADTTCYPGLPTPKEVGKSEPEPDLSGSGPGYVDGVEAEVCRLGESVVYQATPADGKKSPSPGAPTSGGIAPVAPKPLGAGARAAGLAEAAAAEYWREYWSAPFAAGTCGAGAGTCGAGGRAGLKAAADCVRGGYTKAAGAFRWLLLVCISAFGHCASAVPGPTAVASAFSSAVASAAFVASAASSTFSSGVASRLSAKSGKGARGLAAVCLLPGAAAAPAGLPSSALAWLTESVLPIAAVVAVGAFAFVGNFARLRWRRGRTAERRRRRMGNSTKATRVVSPAGPASNPPSPPEPEEAGPSSSTADLGSVSLKKMSARGSMKAAVAAYDKDGDGSLDAEEVLDVVADVQEKQRDAEAAQKEAAKEKKLRMVFKKFTIVLVVALAISLLSNLLGNTAIVFLSKETHVDHKVLVDGEGSVLNVGAALARVPLYALAAFDIAALGRIKQLTVSYTAASGQEVSRNLAIVATAIVDNTGTTTTGTTVELEDALGFKVRLIGTRRAYLVLPDGNQSLICHADADCTSVTVNNDDLKAFEEKAVDSHIAEEDAAAGAGGNHGNGRRLNMAERRRLARRSLKSCNKGQVCSSCFPALGRVPGGVALVNGWCTHFCSEGGNCGETDNYLSDGGGGTDCTNFADAARCGPQYEGGCADGRSDGGVPLVKGMCRDYCSGWNICGDTPDYLENKNPDTGLTGVDCSQFSVCEVCRKGGAHDGGVPLINGRCTGYCSVYGYCGISEVYRNGGTQCTQESALCMNPCPNAFPHVAYEGRICYTDASYASAGSGPCDSWCTNDATFGAGCGDPSSKMCAIDSTNCFDPKPTIESWSAYSTVAANAVVDEEVVQKLCDEPKVCDDWRTANCAVGGGRRLVHTTEAAAVDECTDTPDELLAPAVEKLALPAATCAELLTIGGCELQVVKDLCAKSCDACGGEQSASRRLQGETGRRRLAKCPV